VNSNRIPSQQREIQMNEFHNSDVNTEVWIQADESETADVSEEPRPDLGEKIIDFIKVYWKRRMIAVAIVGTGIVLSVVYALLLHNIYTSTTSLVPPGNSSPYSAMLSMLTGSSTAASLGSEALGVESPGELILSILASRTVQDAMIARFDLMHYYHAKVIENARKMLENHTKIDEDRKSGVITISVTDGNPQFACKVAQGYITELNRVMTENSTSAARRERLFLEGRLKEVKQDLDDSSKALSQFSAKNKALDPSAQAKSMVDAELRLETQLAEGRSQLAALRQTYSEDNYRVRAIEARNAELEQELKVMSGSSKGAGSVASTSESPYPSARELPGLGVTFYDLDRQVRVDEALWEALTKQYEMARVEEAKEIPTIQVLDTANVPNQKSAPRRSMIVIACTFLSFILSCLVIFGLRFWEELDEQSEPKKLFARILEKVKRSPGQPRLS
jgi:uncharacterized protein involved in exopolysaccharide biosynthesis